MSHKSTSIDEKQLDIDIRSLKQIGYDKKLRKLVYHQAKLASKANLDAIVCSAQEAKYVKKIFQKSKTNYLIINFVHGPK